MRLLCVLGKIYHLTIIICCSALEKLWQVLSRSVLCLSCTMICYQRTVRVLVKVMVDSCGRVAPNQASIARGMPLTYSDWGVGCRYIMKRRSHLVAILTQVMCIVVIHAACGRLDHWIFC